MSATLSMGSNLAPVVHLELDDLGCVVAQVFAVGFGNSRVANPPSSASGRDPL